MMVNVISKIKRTKISKDQKTKIKLDKDQKIKRRLKKDAHNHNTMQCAHTWCLRAQKINRLYFVSLITTHNRKKLLNEKNEHVDE